MTPISYRYCHFPAEIIQHTVWLYARFTLSFRGADSKPNRAKSVRLLDTKAEPHLSF